MPVARHPLFLVILALFWGLGSVDSAQANTGQSIDLYKETCQRLTRAQERMDGIPSHLLSAIALAESGRWHAETGEKFAWPWTITARGQGHFFPSKREALEFARQLRSEGVRNIDFGCMQVNLKYHGHAFESLEEMIDPIRNVAYAAKHLKALQSKSLSWRKAAGNYHSFTPERAKSYRLKVLGLWNAERRKAALPEETIQISEASEPERKSYRVIPVDEARTKDLNARFTRNRQLASISEEIENESRNTLDHWRQNRGGGDMALSAQVNRLRAEADRKKALNRPDMPMERALFAERRRAQLDRWRRQNGL